MQKVKSRANRDRILVSLFSASHLSRLCATTTTAGFGMHGGRVFSSRDDENDREGGDGESKGGVFDCNVPGEDVNEC